MSDLAKTSIDSLCRWRRTDNQHIASALLTDFGIGGTFVCHGRTNASASQLQQSRGAPPLINPKWLQVRLWCVCVCVHVFVSAFVPCLFLRMYFLNSLWLSLFVPVSVCGAHVPVSMSVAVCIRVSVSMSMCLYPLCLCLCLYAQKPGTWLSFHVHKKARKLAVIIFIFPQTLIADPALKESPTCAATAALLLGPRSGCLRTASATAEKKRS